MLPPVWWVGAMGEQLSGHHLTENEVVIEASGFLRFILCACGIDAEAVQKFRDCLGVKLERIGQPAQIIYKSFLLVREAAQVRRIPGGAFKFCADVRGGLLDRWEGFAFIVIYSVEYVRPDLCADVVAVGSVLGGGGGGGCHSVIGICQTSTGRTFRAPARGGSSVATW